MPFDGLLSFPPHLYFPFCSPYFSFLPLLRFSFLPLLSFSFPSHLYSTSPFLSLSPTSLFLSFPSHLYFPFPCLSSPFSPSPLPAYYLHPQFVWIKCRSSPPPPPFSELLHLSAKFLSTSVAILLGDSQWLREKIRSCQIVLVTREKLPSREDFYESGSLQFQSEQRCKKASEASSPLEEKKSSRQHLFSCRFCRGRTNQPTNQPAGKRHLGAPLSLARLFQMCSVRIDTVVIVRLERPR